MESVFTAKKVNFQGEDGYMVKQIMDGKVVVDQFISKDGYEGFIKAIDVVPDIYD